MLPIRDTDGGAAADSVNRRFVDETWAKTMLDQPAWVRSALPDITQIVVATYYTERECNPAILYAVVYGDMETYVLVLHPAILRDLNGAGLARALLHLAMVMQWKRPIGSGELGGCTQ